VLVLEYKAVVKTNQAKAIDEAIRTSQFVRNKVLRYWMDNRGIGKKQLYQYNTQLRAEYKFVNELNSHACQASVENVERAISRFFNNCKNNKPGKKGYPQFKKHSRSVEYKVSGWKLHPSKRWITFSDKKGIGELKLLGKWDIHTYPVELVKRVRLVRRADGYYVQFCVKVDDQQDAPQTTSEVGIDVGLESSTPTAMAIMKKTRDIYAHLRKISNGYSVKFIRKRRGHLVGRKRVVCMPVSI